MTSVVVDTNCYLVLIAILAIALLISLMVIVILSYLIFDLRGYCIIKNDSSINY